jgi:hypothetical protein
MPFLYVIAAGLLLLYVGVPLFVMYRLRITGPYPTAPVRIDTLPTEVQQYLREVAPPLEQWGFEYFGCFEPEGSRTVRPFVALWINRRTGQRAQANVLHGMANGVNRFLQFSTTFADGTAVMTANSGAFDFNRFPGLDFLHAPMARDPMTLYQLHLWRESRTGSTLPRYLLPPGEEIRYFVPTPAETSRSMEDQLASWRFRRTSSGANAPTLLGAFALVWPVLPPLSFIFKALERRRGRAQLRAALTQPISPPSSVKVTHRSPYET